jgi:putative intracellular protease/amidase
MVISNQDLWYQDYADTRSSLEAAGLEVVVAAATTETSTPRPTVRPDLTLADVEAEDYSAIVFAGGWGMAQYQYGLEGTYHNSAYRGPRSAALANHLIQEFLQQDKHVSAICYGVSVMAYTRVDGASPLQGKTVAAWNGTLPGFDLGGRSYPAGTVAARWSIGSPNATVALSAAVGDPQTVEDDVIVNGRIITAENYDSAYSFAKALARALAPRR